MPKLVKATKTHILSIGGSLLVPDGGPDRAFLKRLREMILPAVERGERFVLVVGGGKTARHYIDAAESVHGIEREDLDWLGIHATRLNGHLLRTIFRELANPVVVKNPLRLPKKWNEPILVAAGWKPGWSTDYVAVRLANRLNEKSVVNVSNIDYVYSEDPRKNPNAERFETMKWKDYRAIVGDTWDPGLSAPFDPIASKFANKHKMEVAIVNGVDFARVENAFEGREFIGTVLY